MHGGNSGTDVVPIKPDAGQEESNAVTDCAAMQFLSPHKLTHLFYVQRRETRSGTRDSYLKDRQHFDS